MALSNVINAVGRSGVRTYGRRYADTSRAVRWANPGRDQFEAFVLALAHEWRIELAPGGERHIVAGVLALAAGAGSGDLRLSVALIERFRDRLLAQDR